MAKRVVVVGGGISGLTVAYRLVTAAPGLDVTVLEADERAGGKLTTVDVGGLVLPAGADAFVARKPWAVDLCRELGLELVSPAESSAWLWTARGLVPYVDGAAFGIPGDVGDVFRWPGISRRGRRRALLDLVKAKRRSTDDESLGALLRRRLGDEVTDAAVGPLLAGLYAGDVDRLSVAATFPELATWERSQGSLIRGAQAASRAARNGPDPGPLFLRPRDGVQALPGALAASLGSRVRTGARATSITADGTGWRVGLADATMIGADAVIVTTPAHESAGLLSAVAGGAAADLAAITSVSTAVVLLVYGDATGRALPPGSGFVVPRGLAPMTACTWLSSKWPSEAFGTRAVIRCFVGADGAEDLLDAPDDDLAATCAAHLAAALPLPERPAASAVVRWPRSMPRYELGHLTRVTRIREGLPAGIFVSGQASAGVGVPDCVRAAGDAATAVIGHLASSPTSDHQEIAR